VIELVPARVDRCWIGVERRLHKPSMHDKAIAV
jgi:hypothetical protein